ncbi:NUMOD3 domain-containing DNA-binding protein [Lysobacter sp. Root96]|uniref:NUMOD3 domain-containing DNA-binding protein n=1 Tax=Lysobacter sp. Root96 TaxID=1736612 RepID=UPI0009EA49BE|nr:NUMOD3 domain-containing DNA-binding protein [Lysobacter sp. Root96]
MATSGFYVYEHVRLDTGAVFYIGKGHGDRAWRETSRNRYWQSIVAKAGFAVRIRFRTDDEELALFAEMELIASHRRAGRRIANLTDGGEGVVGLRRKQRPEEIERRRIKNLGKRRTPEQCARISAAKKGHGFGKKRSAETRAKIGNASRGRPHPMDALRGRARLAHVVRALQVANDARYAARRDLIRSAISSNPHMSCSQIARTVGCNRDTVSKYKRLTAGGGL